MEYICKDRLLHEGGHEGPSCPPQRPKESAADPVIPAGIHLSQVSLMKPLEPLEEFNLIVYTTDSI